MQGETCAGKRTSPYILPERGDPFSKRSSKGEKGHEGELIDVSTKGGRGGGKEEKGSPEGKKTIGICRKDGRASERGFKENEEEQLSHNKVDRDGGGGERRWGKKFMWGSGKNCGPTRKRICGLWRIPIVFRKERIETNIKKKTFR